jgi:hypothetical protein
VIWRASWPSVLKVDGGAISASHASLLKPSGEARDYVLRYLFEGNPFPSVQFCFLKL